MFYQDRLDALFFENDRSADSLLVVSGYVSPYPVVRCEKLPYKVNIVYGMVSNSKVSPADHSVYTRMARARTNVDIRYSSQSEIHSKLYIWIKDDVPVYGLTGSANFTWAGLNSPKREILTDLVGRDLGLAKTYAQDAFNQSCDCSDPEMDRYVSIGPRLSGSGEKIGDIAAFPKGILSLLSSRTGEVPNRAGINWGFADANVSVDDAYLPLSVGMIRNNPELIPPRLTAGNYPVELVWDDGTVMVGYLEGSQVIDGVSYPKQLSSHPEKNILGRYLRHRISVRFGQKVDKSHLLGYGRCDINILKVGEGRYFLDFRVI